MSLVSPKESQFVKSLLNNAGVPPKTLSRILKLPNEQLLQKWGDPQFNLTEKEIEAISQFFYLNSEELLNGSVSPFFLRKRLFDEPQSLPSRYSTVPYSFVRTSAHIIEYVALVFGRSFADKLLQELNINPVLFDDLDNKINLLFFLDLLEKLKEYGFDHRRISQLACMIFLKLPESSINRELFAQTTYYGFYESLAHNVNGLDKNFEYVFQVHLDKVRIRAYLNNELQDALRIQSSHLTSLLHYRKTLIGWFPVLSQLPPLTATVNKCVSRGDSCTEYEVEFPSHKRLKELQGVCDSVLGLTRPS